MQLAQAKKQGWQVLQKIETHQGPDSEPFRCFVPTYFFLPPDT